MSPDDSCVPKDAIQHRRVDANEVCPSAADRHYVEQLVAALLIRLVQEDVVAKYGRDVSVTLKPPVIYLPDYNLTYMRLASRRLRIQVSPSYCTMPTEPRPHVCEASKSETWRASTFRAS